MDSITDGLRSSVSGVCELEDEEQVECIFIMRPHCGFTLHSEALGSGSGFKHIVSIYTDSLCLSSHCTVAASMSLTPHVCRFILDQHLCLLYDVSM